MIIRFTGKSGCDLLHQQQEPWTRGVSMGTAQAKEKDGGIIKVDNAIVDLRGWIRLLLFVRDAKCAAQRNVSTLSHQR